MHINSYLKSDVYTFVSLYSTVRDGRVVMLDRKLGVRVVMYTMVVVWRFLVEMQCEVIRLSEIDVMVWLWDHLMISNMLQLDISG